ncbi:MAG: LptA/OstA family protein [Hoeflea sp.]|uniref:LptA/OstA family protein n=1 Tax=Hoeflea sp. TaxID=1940281 RepID=UPI0027310991|nr:LptA/OstA family protein [Hoeflea sp.]MDP2120747.1 LptA/OstA family protein [Hoeflea sp.]MDP3524204.1 LptA/OstA family protein [Hoeflea sp.]MDZ7600526.1 LptA/OstA family protein [Hoeflea sp.]
MARSAAFVLKVAVAVIAAGLVLPAPAAFAQGTERRMQGLALSNDEPIQIESDELKIDEGTSKATFTGNVKVVQGDTLLQAGRMVVNYDGDGGSVSSGSAQIREIELYDKVFIQADTQTATADTGNFNMLNEVLVLSGEKVVLTDAENVFIGCKLTVSMKDGQAKLDSCGGRVMIQLDPKSRPQP